MIDVQQLSFRHRDDLPLLFEGFDLTVDRGSKVAVQGASGIGKTTLIYILAGLLPPSSGKILMRDFELTRKREREITAFRNRHVGVIFQEYNLLNQLTVEENLKLRLAIAGVKRSDDEMKQQLDRVGLADLFGRPVSSLSGGQQQRVALVRALVADPEIILADEPTGNLDDQSAAYIIDVLMQGTDSTVLIASHDARLLAVAERRLDFLSLCGQHETVVH
ncbi:MAG: ATP-binding cassette domain-containing protein [Acidobacteria bacterium]|nr:ATP-binding cassette domain-containing protein [Acidobacteriota bacterium]